MSAVEPRGLTEASERLLRDFDLTPDAIDYSELSGRLWLIERQAAETEHRRLARMGAEQTTPEKQAASLRRWNPEIVAVIEADAARTASVAGLDRAVRRIDEAEAQSLAAVKGAVFGEDRIAVMRALDPLSEAIRDAAALLNSAPSIEQEPGEHICANHDESLDEAYRKGVADGQASLREQEPGETLRAAAVALVEAMEANRDAINGGGHDGPHDRVLHHDPCTDLPGVAHVYSSTDDCAQCGGAQYGSDDDLHKATGDLRRVLGLPVRPWEERAALEADPQETER